MAPGLFVQRMWPRRFTRGVMVAASGLPTVGEQQGVTTADTEDRLRAPRDHSTAVTARQDPIRVGTARGLHARRQPGERRGSRDAGQLVLRIGRAWTGSGRNAAAARVRPPDHGRAVVMRIVRALGAFAVLAAVWVAMGVSSASAAAVVETIPVGGLPYGVSLNGTHVWVANADDDTVSEIDASTGTVIDTFPVGSGARYGTSYES